MRRHRAIAPTTAGDCDRSANTFTTDAMRAQRGARAIRAETVTASRFGRGEVSAPSGDGKRAGRGGRGGIRAHDGHTLTRATGAGPSAGADRAVN
jgi:gamma-glutamyl-gamma-aminobutyraldehyde dehydrogenase